VKNFLSIFVFTTLFTQGAFGIEMIGKATFKDQLLYTEKHTAVLDKEGFYKNLVTNYLDSKGEVFAKIQSNFEKNKIVPDYEFEDYRQKFKEKVTLESSSQKINIEFDKAGKVERNTLEIKKNSVLSQGFHNFILSQFKNLMDKKLEVYFVITNRNDQYKFVVQNEKVDQGKIYISIKPANFFLNALVPTTKLVYEIESKRLLTFEGLTNIDDSNGKTLTAKIDYTYQ
jgi:hypothetical protein